MSIYENATEHDNLGTHTAPTQFVGLAFLPK